MPLILFSRAFFPSGSFFVVACLGLLFGGNLGNGLDRWVRGYVVDFVDVGIGGLRWYTFNIADASFVVGVIALVFAMLFLSRRSRRRRRGRPVRSTRRGDSGGATPSR